MRFEDEETRCASSAGCRRTRPRDAQGIASIPIGETRSKNRAEPGEFDGAETLKKRAPKRPLWVSRLGESTQK